MSVGHLAIVTVVILYGNSQDLEMKTLNPLRVIQEAATIHNLLQPLPQVKEVDSVKLQEALLLPLVDKVQAPQLLEVVKPQVKVTEVEMLQLLVRALQEMPVAVVAEMFHKPMVPVVLFQVVQAVEVNHRLAQCKK